MRWCRGACVGMAAWLCVATAWAEQVVLGLSQNEVSITATFDGSDILIYGAVRRDKPPADPPLEVIVAVTGPEQRVTIRRKARRFGIWVNVEAVEVDAAPSFYAVASTGPLAEVLSQTEDLRHRVSLDRAVRAVDVADDAEDVGAFLTALERIRVREGRYSIDENAVALAEATLFSTSIGLPADLTEGIYRARIFLTRDGAVVDMLETQIPVRKVGLERWLYTLAHGQPLVYGIMSLAIAVAAGWAASAGFAALRR